VSISHLRPPARLPKENERRPESYPGQCKNEGSHNHGLDRRVFLRQYYTTPPNCCEVCGGSIDPFPAPTNGARRPPDERDADDAQNAHEHQIPDKTY